MVTLTTLDLGPVTDSIEEVLAPIWDDVSALVNLTNERAPFFEMQYEWNEKV